MMVPAGIGAVVGAMVVSKFLQTGVRKKNITEVALLIMGTVVFSLILLTPIVGVWFKIPFIVLMFFLVGFSFVGAFVPPLTYLQESTPGGLMGRVFGNFWFLTTAVSVLPVLFSATLAEVFGVDVLFLLMGVFYILALIALRFRYER